MVSSLMSLLAWSHMLILQGQSSPLCYQQSATTIRHLKRKDRSKNPIIVGEFRDIDTKELLPGPKVYFTAQRLWVDSNPEGRFAKEISEGEYSLLGISFSYETFISKSIPVAQGDSIVINFNLKAVDQPLESHKQR
jgi:hypothetical protein